MDTAHFTELLRQNAGLIHKIAFAYCHDATDREEVVQEIAVQLWGSRDRYDDRFRQSTWIYRIALNVAISFHRKERRHREGREPLDQHAFTVAPEPDTESGEDVRVLRQCIEGLAALDKALVLLALDGNDHASIAEVLGISTSNVSTKLARIKDRLRRAFEARTRPHSPRFPELSHDER